MNKTTLKELGLYIDYWTKQGLDAKASLKVEKANKNREYKEPEVEFIPPTKEELRKAHLEKRKKRAEKLENLPYSNYHNELVNNLYGKRVDILKKNAIIAAHEEAIRNIMIKKSIRESLKAYTQDKLKPNLLIVKQCFNYNDIRDFMIIPSSRSLDDLHKIGKKMYDSLKIAMPTFFHIEIWEKKEYMSVISGGKGNYRYVI